jgi:TetR/AcrR family transcriptional regulator
MKAALKSASTSPPSRRGSETRSAILAAAARNFARAGLGGARTEAIAAAAGVNKAMLYYYFKSKDLLYAEVLESHFKEFHRRAMEVLGEKGSAGSTVLRFVETHFDFISSQRDYPRLFQQMMMTDAQRGARLVRKYLVPVSRKLFEVVQRGRRTGEFRRLDSRHVVISLVALNVFYFSTAPVMKMVTRIDPYSAANLKHRKDEVLAFVRYGLFRDPEGPVS